VRLLVVLLSLAGGCLPAYDNMAGLTTDDGGGADASPDAGSGLFVTGIVASFEDVKYGAGAVVHIGGYEDFMSMPADNAGHFKVEIPQVLVDSKEPAYLVIDGNYLGSPLLKTWDAPKRVLDGTAKNQNIGIHFYKNQDDMMGVRGLVAKALANHGDIPSAASFATDYSFMTGYLYELTPGGERDYRNFTVELSADGNTLDNTNCKPSMQCCFYYGYDYPAYKTTMPQPAEIIDFTATSSPLAFYVVCPGAQTGDITIKQTAPLNQIFNQTTGMHPSKPFSDIQAPRVKGDAVLIFWSVG
jgi:hypothetical protein